MKSQNAVLTLPLSGTQTLAAGRAELAARVLCVTAICRSTRLYEMLVLSMLKIEVPLTVCRNIQ